MSSPATHAIRGRLPRGRLTLPEISRDAARIHAHLVDAARVPGGRAEGVATPATEGEVAALLVSAPQVLAVGAQSSLTGGATPTGGLVLSTAAMTAIDARLDRAIVQPGATLSALDAALRPRGAWYPPAPTYPGATVGGVIATNAAGAATFKYGTTRAWVEALTVVLATGDVLDVERGAVHAHPDGYFDIELSAERVRVEVPPYRWPDLPKVSCGYAAAPGMDLIDLFIGAEGTLGVVTAATLRTAAPRPATALAWVTCRSRTEAIALVGQLRAQARDTWQSADRRGLDVSAIEHMDRRCLELLHEDGVDAACDIAVPGDAALALLVTLELPADITARDAFAEIGGALAAEATDTPLVRFCRLLDRAGLLERTEIALPGDRRQAALLAFREAVPTAVNQRVGLAQRTIDPAIEKVAADVIVPFARLADFMAAVEQEFAQRRLDGAVWGHISDGNLHPNVMPRSATELIAGKDAVLSLGRLAIDCGGAPCAEHGVGRNPIKRQLVHEWIGGEGLAAMRRVKRALDPRGVLAPGVLGL